ncbi:unnamed protein product [Symbiodinium sp. KB8]|nr:unnamed protein product [Symbiodinium sp. KB8]
MDLDEEERQRWQTSPIPAEPWSPPGGPLTGEPKQGGKPRTIGDFFGRAAAQGSQGTHSPIGLPVASPKRSYGHLHVTERRRPSVDGASTSRSGSKLARPAKQGKVTKSLKQTLLQYVTAEIITRVTTFASDKSAQAKAQEMGWVTSDLEYNYLDWSAEEQRLVPRQEGTLTQDQVLADARRLKALLKQQELIIKFSAARNAQPDSTSETATFVLELSMQIPEAAEVMSIFRKWFASSALLLLSLRLKPARPERSPERSPLIKEIQEAVGW